MFVSSYSTYISTTVNDKTNKPKVDTQKTESKPFGSILSKDKPLQAYDNKHIPINYISNYKSFSNQQKLQEQVKSKDEVKFKKISNIKNAKTAYESNSTIFSLMSIPKVSLSHLSTTSNMYDKNAQEAKENNMRHKMVNTYLANDKYYQITA